MMITFLRYTFIFAILIAIPSISLIGKSISFSGNDLFSVVEHLFVSTKEPSEDLEYRKSIVPEIAEPQTVEMASTRSPDTTRIETAHYQNKDRSVQSDEFARLKSELHDQLGATFSRLENWGTDGSLVRFSCTIVSPGGSQSVQTCFQAIESDPLTAIQAVVREVREWKKSKQY